jgi:ATP phosphoribosyltransferase regulatory subunit HisZ
MLAEPLVLQHDLLVTMAEVIDGLQSEDLRFQAGSGLGARLKSLHRSINRLQAEAARTMEVFDRTNAYEVDGSFSAASWLRHRCNVSYNTASNQVQLARRLPELPQAQAAFASGDISTAHVSLMARAAD